MASIKQQINRIGEGPWDFNSGNLALDFANTIDWPGSDQSREMFNSYVDLLSWAKFYSALTGDEIEFLAAEADRHPRLAVKALKQAIALRDAVYLTFTAVAHNEQADSDGLVTIKDMWGQAVLEAEITPGEKHFTWSWDQKKSSLEYILYPVAHAAMELLLSKNLLQVGQCADDRGCGLLFIDTSKNHSRQWCSMEDCGNRAKAQRYYRRKKGKG
jgi:predicted RNA-binding Zn ribbon-like protein